MLSASWELHKFFHDCKDALSRIVEKQHSISDELGRDAGSVSALQRKHQNFVQDLVMLHNQVRVIMLHTQVRLIMLHAQVMVVMIRHMHVRDMMLQRQVRVIMRETV